MVRLQTPILCSFFTRHSGISAAGSSAGSAIDLLTSRKGVCACPLARFQATSARLPGSMGRGFESRPATPSSCGNGRLTAGQEKRLSAPLARPCGGPRQEGYPSTVHMRVRVPPIPLPFPLSRGSGRVRVPPAPLPFALTPHGNGSSAARALGLTTPPSPSPADGPKVQADRLRTERSRVRVPSVPPPPFFVHETVAQLDRAPGYEPGGRRFKSARFTARHAPCPAAADEPSAARDSLP